jgi:hypothetical protein
MPAQLKLGLGRILAARQGLLDARTARTEMLQRFRAYARTRLGEFVSNVDPITGMRIVELNAEGSKTTGEMAIVLAFFEGTRLRIGVDPTARLTAEATPPELLPPMARVLDVEVSTDLSRAELIYEPKDAPAGTRRSVDLTDVLAALIDNAAQHVESILRANAPPARAAAAAAGAIQAPPPKAPALSFSPG